MFCSFCGFKHVIEEYPKLCENCQQITWSNPIPVAVWVQSVEHVFEDGYTRTGLAIAKRAIEPRIGTWNLLGGHIGDGETAEEGGRREWLEETGLDAHETGLRITGSYANGKGHILIAIQPLPITLYEFAQARLCPENSEFDVMWSEDQIELGFPIHQRIAHKWFMEEKPSEKRMTAEVMEYASEIMKWCVDTP